VALKLFFWFSFVSPAGRARKLGKAAFSMNKAAAGLADAAKK